MKALLRQVVRHSLRRPELTEAWNYSPDVVYQIDDLEPFLYVSFDVTLAAKCEDSDQQLVSFDPSTLSGFPGDSSLQWWKWFPLNERSISEARRFGLYTLRVKAPCRAEVRCYLWPARLMSRDEFVSMTEDIVRELRVRELSDHASTVVRQYVGVNRRERAEVAEEVLLLLPGEIRAAGALCRVPYVEPEPERPGDSNQRTSSEFGDLQDLPENRLLATWMSVRYRQLMTAKELLEEAIEDLKGRAVDAQDNVKQKQEIEGRIDVLLSLLRRVELFQKQMMWLRLQVKSNFAPGVLSLSPAMQRDPRLACLLGAVSSRGAEWPIIAEGPLSRRPPMKAPNLFELWVAVRVVSMLRRLGWQGCVSRVIGTALKGLRGGVEYCCWLMKREDFELSVEFGAQPQKLDFEQIPPPGERSVSAWTWAASRTGAPKGWVRQKSSTPDYLLKLTCGTRVAIAIGDASLTDPERQTGEKIKKVDNYRSEVAWHDGAGKITWCAPMGVFVVFPKVGEFAWDALIRSHASVDCQVITLSPGGEDPVGALGHFMEMLISAVSTA